MIRKMIFPFENGKKFIAMRRDQLKEPGNSVTIKVLDGDKEIHKEGPVME